MSGEQKPGGVEYLINLVEHACRANRSLSSRLKKIAEHPAMQGHDVNLEHESALLTAQIRALEYAIRNVYAAPDETPQGIYLDELLANLNAPYHWVTPTLQRWIVHRLREGRTLVRRLLEEIEILGAKLRAVADAQQWITMVDEGPDLSSQQAEPAPTDAGKAKPTR